MHKTLQTFTNLNIFLFLSFPQSSSENPAPLSLFVSLSVILDISNRGSSVFDFVAARSHRALLPLPLGEGRGEGVLDMPRT